MEKLYQSTKTRLGADCGSDHELLIAKFRHKLKKVGKTTRPFRYDLNQIPYDYKCKLWLETITDGLEKVNAMFGTDISCGLRFEEKEVESDAIVDPELD